MEEKSAAIHGLKNFFSIHKDIFEVYLFAFLGVFIGFVLIGLIFGSSLFDFQMGFLEFQQGITEE
ncbi:hypothetical protein HQ545_00765 [Candidatus Woesearchaeota archaeon]|nr:hypothetical protein [Candidatus Woesearchaeota archaeon]